MPAAHERRTANADASPLHLLPPTQMQLRPPTRCCSQSHAPPRRSSLAALHSRPADVLPMQLQARCIHCHRRRCEAAAAARELTAAASGSTSEPARPTQRRVGCIHCHRRRPRMSSLQLQVGRRQSQRDRHRSCSQPRRSLVLTFECPPHMSDVLPMQMQARPAAFTATDAGAMRQLPAARELTAAASGSMSEPARPQRCA